jgi:carboxyl-terminal processing protease
MKEGMAKATGDPYTEYFTAKKAKDFEGQINNSFSGIGAELGKDKDDNLIIVSPIGGFPADKAGLKPQDIITTINGESSSNLSIDDAVGKIRGEKGTKVTLQIVRNKAEQLSITITRDDIKIESVKKEILDSNIGYVSINTFATDTAALFEKTAGDLRQDGVKGIVLDLRGNPGGVLDAAVQISEQWLPQGKTILQEKRGDVVIKTYTSEGRGQLQGIPTVVLINEGSASASEIVAGALRDNNAARLIGEKSYGKGVVQQPICVAKNSGLGSGGCEGDMLKVTVASWFRPNGQNINKKGITPDQTIKISDEDIAAQKDTQKDAAIKYLQSKQ